ncbi:hypothetical protein J7E50_01335 [Pedobacter sp. ISL-68]|uniref:hypothetical protein n=1 Tax=unclassified Pedobacter TaxID=2628915 RepID=UPI001BECD781|nr:MULTISPECIES: hypothetical protein [unclassified Pedobacter]MBT2563401.1 hypothetical protein [Pedobacter sp. ISL-64]MBT2588844.1 hypothetical protein [Pedobacter sp. ISL-68]
MKKTLIICLAILILINVPPISWFCKIITEDYTYSSYNGVIQYQENLMKGTNFNTYAESFDERIKSDPNIKDKQLYRTFTLKPWRFWEWHEWVVHYKRFMLPYISEEQILQNRKKEGLPEKY